MKRSELENIALNALDNIKMEELNLNDIKFLKKQFDPEEYDFFIPDYSAYTINENERLLIDSDGALFLIGPDYYYFMDVESSFDDPDDIINKFSK